MSPSDQIATSFNCIITSPDQVLFEGEVVRLDVPGLKQQLAILPDHTPLYAQLNSGEVIAHDQADQTESIPIQGGVIRIRSNQATIITGFDTPDQASTT